MALRSRRHHVPMSCPIRRFGALAQACSLTRWGPRVACSVDCPTDDENELAELDADDSPRLLDCGSALHGIRAYVETLNGDKERCAAMTPFDHVEWAMALPSLGVRAPLPSFVTSALSLSSEERARKQQQQLDFWQTRKRQLSERWEELHASLHGDIKQARLVASVDLAYPWERSGNRRAPERPSPRRDAGSSRLAGQAADSPYLQWFPNGGTSAAIRQLGSSRTGARTLLGGATRVSKSRQRGNARARAQGNRSMLLRSPPPCLPRRALQLQAARRDEEVLRLFEEKCDEEVARGFARWISANPPCR